MVFVGWGASGGVFRVWGVEAGIGKGVWGRGDKLVCGSVGAWGMKECVRLRCMGMCGGVICT